MYICVYISIINIFLFKKLFMTLQKEEYVELLKLHQMGFVVECNNLVQIMKTKKQTMKKSTPKKSIKKRSVGRPRKSKIKEEPLSDSSSENIVHQKIVTSKIPIGKVQICRTTKPLLKSNSEIQVFTNFLSIILRFFKILLVN